MDVYRYCQQDLAQQQGAHIVQLQLDISISVACSTFITQFLQQKPICVGLVEGDQGLAPQSICAYSSALQPFRSS